MFAYFVMFFSSDLYLMRKTPIGLVWYRKIVLTIFTSLLATALFSRHCHTPIDGGVSVSLSLCLSLPPSFFSKLLLLLSLLHANQRKHSCTTRQKKKNLKLKRQLAPPITTFQDANQEICQDHGRLDITISSFIKAARP